MASDELPILVGVDGSEQSQAAIDLGVREARLRGRSLRLVHACYRSAVGNRSVRLAEVVP